MNKIKLTLIIGIVSLLSLTGLCATNDLFKAGLSLQADTSYAINAANIKNNNYSENFSAGVVLFVSKYVGFEAETPIYSTDGKVFQNISFGGILRFPNDTIVLDHVAPYLRGGEVYQFNNSDWSSYVGAGLEVKLVKDWSLFIDGDYYFDDVTKIQNGNFGARAGIRLAL